MADTEKYSSKRKYRKIKMKAETKKYLREFGDVTTLHGIRYVAEKETHFVERICWVIAILVCAVLCGLEIGKVWNRWQNSPVIISFAQRPTNVASIPFPSLTICPENKVRRSLVDMQKNFTWMEERLNGSVAFESTKERLLAEAVSMVCLEKSENISLALPHNFIPVEEHIKIIAREISFQIEDIFETCYLESENIDCSKLFRPILTYYGLCYTFNTLDSEDLYSDNVDRYPLQFLNLERRPSMWNSEKGYSGARKTNDFPVRNGVYVGPKMGLQLVLKVPREDIQQPCSMKDADTFKLALQPPTQFPDPYFNGYIIASPGDRTSIALQPSLMTTASELNTKSYKPQLRGCNFPEDGNQIIYRTYSQMNCIWECENRIIRDECNCMRYYLPMIKNDTIPYCSITASESPHECGQGYLDKINEIFYSDVEERLDAHGEAAACDCLPSCTELKYEFQVAHDVFKNKLWENDTTVDHAAVTMYFQFQTFLGKHRSELYGITDFIASCGGLLGLFTGFSVITAIEIFYFASLRICCKLRRGREVIHEIEE